MKKNSKHCLTCRHCYKNEYCSLFDELIEDNLSCWMWSDEKK